ncbi:MAG: Transcription elongation factor SPT4 [Pycnora praestabilis]|nr:MAG: Transcription elongation factor SPT4 [Pycnora praestabilis]
MSSTPSPTASATPNSTASRRPPRKSTLTQQQKNQKRQRATQDQLITLEVEFNKNPTPTAIVRERIAQDINMTERSVQIWFQNRRAKIKLIAKKSIETGDDCDSIPDSMRQYLAIQAMESGKPLGRNFLGRTGGPMAAYGNGGMLLNADQNSSGKVVIHHFACRSLSIGSWRRVGQNAMDLVVFYSPDKACLTYYINNDSAGYKIEYPFAHIKNISLDNGDPLTNAQGMPQKLGGLIIELNRPPNFFMDSSGSGGFYQCGDFTEEQQASQVMVHHLGGHPKVLSGQLAKLVSLECFQNRHNVYDPHAMSASAPVSPVGHRPASQPNHLSHPHIGMFQESQFGISLQPGRGGHGHKRTRSRSVPAAIDFSMLQNPMPSFHIQHEPSAVFSNPNIFAPIPQHHHNNNNLGPMGSNLRIDTSSGYNMDFRHYPLSAATTTSPSEYASPSFFTHAENMPTANFNTPYSLPFLSPMVDHSGMVGPSVSPLSAMSHGDPVIADQSPPMSTMHRSHSADIFSMTHDHSNMEDDGLALSELYSKQSLNLPMHSPGVEGSSEDMDMHNLVSFGTIDPSSLSPEDASNSFS